MTKAIALPFSFDTDGRVNSTTDLKKIIQDRVVLVVMTTMKERVMRPKFGTNVNAATFQSLANALPIIKQEVAVGFSTWLPYLHLIGVEGNLDSENYLNVVVTYKYGASANAETVTVKTATLTQSGSVISEVPYGQQ